jgi:hypothetical protein
MNERKKERKEERKEGRKKGRKKREKKKGRKEESHTQAQTHRNAVQHHAPTKRIQKKKIRHGKHERETTSDKQ